MQIFTRPTAGRALPLRRHFLLALVTARAAAGGAAGPGRLELLNCALLCSSGHCVVT